VGLSLILAATAAGEYIRPDAPTIKIKPYQGDAYEALVPDTLDLAENARLAVNGILATVDPDVLHTMWFSIALNRRTPWMRHGEPDTVNDSKTAESLPLARLMSGSDQYLDLEMAQASTHGASLRGLVVELVVCSDQGQPLLSLMNVDDEGVALPSATRCTVTARLSGPTFIPGRYRLNAFLGVPYLEHVDEIPDAFEFQIVPPERPWRPYELHITRGIVCRKAQWGVVSDRQPA
jgi:hypothetical protein